MMRGKPFLETAKDDEREALLRRLAIALAPKSQCNQNESFKHPPNERSTRQE